MVHHSYGDSTLPSHHVSHQYPTDFYHTLKETHPKLHAQFKPTGQEKTGILTRWLSNTDLQKDRVETKRMLAGQGQR